MSAVLHFVEGENFGIVKLVGGFTVHIVSSNKTFISLDTATSLQLLRGKFLLRMYKSHLNGKMHSIKVHCSVGK